MFIVAKPKRTIADELPYLGGMEVIEEVFALIMRLENDRTKTGGALLNEKHRSRKLQQKMDEMSRKRCEEFAQAVQTGKYYAILHSGCTLQEIYWCL